MAGFTRRSVLGSAVGLAAAGSLARPYIANAAAKTAVVWWIQGFAHEEDIAFKKIVEDYEKASGNTIDYTIVPYAPLRQKIVSAVTSGVVPDSIPEQPDRNLAIVGLGRQAGRLDRCNRHTERGIHRGGVALCLFVTTGSKRRAAITLAPYQTGALPNHVWRPLVEKAGYKMEDIPKTWDAYYDFFKDVQKKLRDQGMRHVYGLGFQVTTQGNDPNNFFNYFLIAYGGKGIVTKDGKLHVDDPKVREAVIKALTYPTNAYKEGFVPSGAINWNDSDDNNAFHSKQIVMDLDGTISTEVAIIKDKQDYDDIVVMGLPLSNDGKPVPAQVTNFGGMIPKGAKNIDVAKDFLKYLIQPKVAGEYLKIGLGRNIPAMPSIVKKDPWWSEDPHRKAYVEHGATRADSAGIFCLQPGLRRSPQPACLGRCLGRCHSARNDP